MRTLLRFIQKYSNLLLFLLLEAIAITFMVQGSTYQRSKLVGLNREITGYLFSKVDGAREYFSLKEANELLVEESVLGWEELELEVVRDAKNQIITVCFIENVDAMGVHTGDSYCTAPMLTISPELQDRLKEYSYRIVEAIEVIGGTNIQFAHDPKTGRVVVIEINPRTSRSSALASKATGYPIAKFAARLAVGLTQPRCPECGNAA